MKRIFFITGCFITLLFTACTKELSDNFNPYPNSPLNDTIWVRNVAATASVNDLFDQLAPGFIVDSFNLTTGATLHYGDTLDIEFKPAIFTSLSGAAPVGNMARVEILQLKRKGDFIKFFKPTTTDNGSLLVSGGGLFIRVTSGEKELSLANGNTVKVKFSDVDTAKTFMQGFYGKETNPAPLKGIDTSFSWFRDSDAKTLTTWAKTGNGSSTPSYTGYEMNAKNLRWISAETYYDSTLPKAKLTAILSPNFTNKNTAVFVVFNKQKTVVGMHGDFPSRSFFANNIPTGASVKLVSLSQIGGDFYLGIENVSSVGNIAAHKINPEKKTLKEILAYLNSL